MPLVDLKGSITVDIDPRVFNGAFLPYLTNMARTQVFYGGSSSGKSRFLAQRCVFDLLGGGRNYLICRQVARTVRTSVFAEVVRVIAEWDVGKFFRVSKTDYAITGINGCIAVFIGLDDVEKIKSIVPAQGAWTDIWIEEATETPSIDTIKQLRKRQRGGDPNVPKRLILSFNPILRSHWIYKYYFADVGWHDSQSFYTDDQLAILKTTYKDNKFLTASDIEDLEGEEDEYFRNVYTLGLWGVLGNVIYKKWRVEDLSGMKDRWANRRHGLDFGFSNDPAAIGVTHYDAARKTIYFYNELYQTGLTNDQLAVEALRLIGHDSIICDSAEPKSIAELRRYGVMARSARKGRDSIKHGIQWLQQQTIIVDRACINMQNEISQYKWKENSLHEPLPIPVDRNNHLMDQLRYAYEDDMSNRADSKARSWRG